MDYFNSISSTVVSYFQSINSATLTGAIDVIVVEQPDGSLQSTPFHVRFGKYGVFNSDDKYVDIMINQEEHRGIKMKLAENGVAHFVKEIPEENEVPAYLASSPVPSSPPSTSNGGEEHTRRQRRVDARARFEKNRPAAAEVTSRSPSPNRIIAPAPPSSRPAPEAPQNSDTTSFDAETKKKLPFSSSIFSHRRNRSMPNLSGLTANFADALGAPESSNGFKKGHSRKLTMDASTMNSTTRHQSPTPLSPRSQSSMPTNRSSPTKTNPTTTTSGTRKPTTSSEDSDSDGNKPPSAPMPAKKPSAASLDLIADGALSDSEVERTKNTASSSTVWRWGEFPYSSSSKKKKTTEKDSSYNNSYWGWLWWKKSSNAGGAGQQNPDQAQGIYLNDLMTKDPTEQELYFGNAGSTVSSIADSGNGHSVPTPASPSALSMDSLVSDDAPTTVAGTPDLTDHSMSTPRAIPGAEISEDEATVSDDGTDEPLNGGRSLSFGDVKLTRTKYIRSLRLTSDQLKSLGLRYGANEARFSITTKFQGTACCVCHIHVLKYSEKIVISDIDGTITRSDVLGHIMPAIGGQWAHRGVAELYTRIKNNGYKMVYLSSRAIGQSHYTKTYLSSVAQGSRNLPDGPMLLSPTSVLMALRKEVIERKPEEFKIACLTDLLNCFPSGTQPFYAGFGNRPTDTVSYKAVGIPTERIFIIDPNGILIPAVNSGYISSYSDMADETVDYIFPPLHRERNSLFELETMKPNFSNPDTCSTFTHWQSIPTLDDAALEEYERKRKELSSMKATSSKKWKA